MKSKIFGEFRSPTQTVLHFSIRTRTHDWNSFNIKSSALFWTNKFVGYITVQIHRFIITQTKLSFLGYDFVEFQYMVPQIMHFKCLWLLTQSVLVGGSLMWELSQTEPLCCYPLKMRITRPRKNERKGENLQLQLRTTEAWWFSGRTMFS